MDYANMKNLAKVSMPRPISLQEIWTERELCERLGLPMTKGGHSIQLSNWIKGGLRYMEKSGRRYFYEQDVIDYMMNRYQDGLSSRKKRKGNTELGEAN